MWSPVKIEFIRLDLCKTYRLPRFQQTAYFKIWKFKHWLSWTPIRRDFSKNNYKTQTISLVRKRLKLIWNITTRVQRGRFPGFFNFIIPRNRVERTRLISLENESKGLGFKAWKPSPLHSVSKPGNRVRYTRFLGLETESFELGFFVCKNQFSLPSHKRSRICTQQNSDIGIQLLANEIDNNVNELKHPSPVLAITPILVVNLGLFWKLEY